jgi:CBS domain-containing protein
MKTGDIMTQDVISVGPGATVKEAAEIMLREHISGLPVINDQRVLVGIITEGDLLRRTELGTQKQRPQWLEFMVSPGTLAREYVRSHARTVENVMTAAVRTVDEDTPLPDVVETMERFRVKRLPVMRAGRVVGIITRANLLHALAATPPSATTTADTLIRDEINRELVKQRWCPRQTHIVVRQGVVDLWGIILNETERRAIRIAAENVPGVKEVRDHMVWVEPHAGAVIGTGTSRDPPEANKSRSP